MMAVGFLIKTKEDEIKQGWWLFEMCELERKFEKQDEKPEMDLFDEILKEI